MEEPPAAGQARLPREFLQGFVRNGNFQGYLNCPKGRNPPPLLDYVGIYILYETEQGIQK